MPQFYHKTLPKSGELGLWKIEEEEGFFASQLQLYPIEQIQLAEIQGKKRIEWLSSRYLLHAMSGRKNRGACVKDEYGKPHLTGSNFEISLSHSWEVVAVMAAPYIIGVDIQRIVEKINRIAHKFMRPEESASLETATYLEHLHVYWCAKEALYKAYGRKKLDFLGHIHITPFQYDLSVGECSGLIEKGKLRAEFKIKYEKIEDYILVYGIETNESLIEF